MKSIYLIIPGLGNSSPKHWQTLWEKEFPERFTRIQQEVWETPTCSNWVENVEKEFVNTRLKTLF